MPSSTPSSLRHRPAILVLTGVAVAYTIYLIYSAVEAQPGDGLHRSNALRRRSRRRASAAVPAVAVVASSNEQERSTNLGTFLAHGISLPLSLDSLMTAEELQQIITQARPDLSEQQIESTIACFYDEFLDRLLRLMFDDQVPVVNGIDAIRASYGDIIQDETAIQLAVQRHTERIAQGNDNAVDRGDSVAGTELSWRDSEDDSDDDTLDEGGQTLQRTLYHIAEDRARQEGIVHRGITCNSCEEKPIRGIRWHCANCADFDLCSNCEATNSHDKTHIFYKIRVPAPHLSLQKQEPLYPGKPHLMGPSIESALKKRLVSETKMEVEEMEALWDQFTCLAGSRWNDDPSNVGYALDRRAFNHAFVPRYNSFTAAPNLVYDRIFAYYDTDKNGLIGFDEWIKGIAGMHTTDVETKARIVFNGYDIDGDGYISRQDLLRLFRAYYAIEKEATKNYVAEITEEHSPRNQMEKIRSSQPLGSAFTPNNMAFSEVDLSALDLKQQYEDENILPVLDVVGDSDFVTRDHVLKRLLAGNSHPTTDELDQIVTERWNRKEFYVDEEEGMARPSAVHNETNEDTAEQNKLTEVSRLERFDGFDVPEAEKDLGQEVLYQVTQQGFNELLDPIFQEKENLAMDVYNTRSLRRENAAAIDAIRDLFKDCQADAELVAQIGFFRFSKFMVEMFCDQFNFGCREGLMQESIRVEGASYFDSEMLKSVLYRLYSSNEVIMHRALKAKVIKAAGYPDVMTSWNMMLCMQQLREEILHAAFDCVSRLGWFKTRADTETPCTDQDPTLPQFRSNSAAETNTTWTCNDASSSSDEDPRLSQQPSVYGYKIPITTYQLPSQWRSETGRYVEPAPSGPFFVYTDPTPTSPENEDAVEGGEVEEPPSIDSLSTPPTGGPEPASTREAGSQDADPSSPQCATDVSENPIVNLQAHTNSPAMHVFSMTPPAPGDGANAPPVLSSHAIPATRADVMLHENHLKPLVHRIRQRAMDPDSKLHIPMLASLELVEQEIRERKGGGRITFEEFAAHMREGNLKFLESWMEWVSI